MSAPRPLPADLLAFIHTNVSSLEMLEILLLLRRERESEWTAASVSHELRIDGCSAARRLAQLARSGLASERSESCEVYRYATPSHDVARLVDALADAYAQRRLQVINAVYARPSEHIQVFADAFRLRKE